MMKDQAIRGTRILYGFLFLFFGLNGFFGWFQPPLNEAGASFMGAMAATGYFFPVLKLTEIICGALLMAGLFVPLALVVLAPIVIQILLFHIFIDLGGLPIALALTAFNAGLAYVYRASFAGVLAARPNAHQ